MLLGSALFALLAGILSTLSPCVLPLLPIILVTAVSEHRLGPARPRLGAGAVVRRHRHVHRHHRLRHRPRCGLLPHHRRHDAGRRSASSCSCRNCRRRLPPPLRRSAAGPRSASAASRPPAFRGSSRSASCSAPCGALASDQRSAPPPCWRRRGEDLAAGGARHARFRPGRGAALAAAGPPLP